jgi:Transposase
VALSNFLEGVLQSASVGTSTPAVQDARVLPRVALGIKEQLRTLLACGSLADAHEEKMRLGYYVMVADMAETWRLWETINAWWTEIEVFLITGVTNARTEAAKHEHQTAETHGPGLPQRRTLQITYPPAQCRPTCGMNTKLSARHHVKL